MKDISATEAARHLSDVLDAVEHRHESFTVFRSGRIVARITPVASPTGRAVKDAILANRPDRAWAGELESLRSILVTEDRPWND